MILGIIQARMSSTRLRGKVLKEVSGMPLVALQVLRAKGAKRMDHLIVATSTDASDDPLVRAASQFGFDLFRGTLLDVLDRFYQAAKPYSPAHVVRLTADCPLTDPALVDQAISVHLESKSDYTTNARHRVVPDGFDVEVMSFQALKTAQEAAQTPYQKEHVTPYFYQHPDLFKQADVPGNVDYARYRMSVDYPEDFEVVKAIFDHFYPDRKAFTMEACVAFLKAHPELINLNQQYVEES